MSKNLGVEMTVLRHEDRNTLMKGMILRRLRSPLTRSQLDVAISADIQEIQRRWAQFDFEDYTGADLDAFYSSMKIGMLINERPGLNGVNIYERGKLADEFDDNLSEDMEWSISELPMSTRGFFDKLKDDPDRRVTVDINDLVGGKQVVKDTRHRHKQGDQSRQGPIIRP